MMIMLGNNGRKFYTFRVHVHGTDPTYDDALDVNAFNEREAWRQAKIDADELYVDYTLTLISAI